MKKLVLVEFLDHVKDGFEPMSFKACGWVVKENDVSITLTTWLPEDEEDEGNYEVFTLLKQVVIKILPLPC